MEEDPIEVKTQGKYLKFDKKYVAKKLFQSILSLNILSFKS